MVDFNQDSTMSKPPQDVVALIVLEKVYNYLEAEEEYTKGRLNGVGVSVSTCRARLKTLFMLCSPMLKRRLKRSYDDLRNNCLSEKGVEYGIIQDSFFTICEELDKLGLTKLDTKPYVDRQNIEKSNKASGF